MTTEAKNPWERTFWRLLAREAEIGAAAPEVAAAARRLYERLAQQLTPLVGAEGVGAVCARSVHLVQRKFPWVGSVRTSDRLANQKFTAVQQSMEQQEPAVAREAAVAVLATVAELLASFIGEGLTIRLLREAWPDEFAGGTVEEIT